MKQQNASSFATLRISTVLAMLWALPVGPVSAIPIQLTSGEITFVSFRLSSGDEHTFVFLAGPGFALTTDGYFDTLQFSTSNPYVLDLLPLGTTPLTFSGGVQVVSGSNPGSPESPPPASVLYGGESYFASGVILVGTPTFAVAPLVTLPFSLWGQIHATNFMGTDFDFEISGAGTVTAGFYPYPTGQDDSFLWATSRIQYTIEPPPIPEPTSWMLLGSGLLGVAARRRSTRLNR
jgi:hypothetical protein